MTRYFKSEFYRITRKKATLITFISAIIFIILCYLMMVGSSSVEVDRKLASPLFQFAGGSLILYTAPFLVIVVTSMVLDSEMKENAYNRAIESGIRRRDIVIVKILNSFIAGIILLLTAYLFNLLVSGLIFGFSIYNINMLIFFIKSFILLIIPITAMILLSILIYMTVKNDFLNGILYLIFGVAISKILEYISLLSGKNIVLTISEYLPAGTFKMIYNNIGIFKIIQYGKLENVINTKINLSIFTDNIQYLAVNIGIIVLIVAALFINANRRDFD